MDAEATHALRRLLDARPVAALGTLHRGEPAVSMVPFVLMPGRAQFVIHVSALSPHTRDMLEHPHVSLLVMDELRADVPPQALARVALQADARMLERGSDEHSAARDAYVSRFADAAVTFELADFSLVALRPRSARLVAGFGRAGALVGAALADWLRG